jgi:hypothetical protein
MPWFRSAYGILKNSPLHLILESKGKGLKLFEQNKQRLLQIELKES